jgi:hypothetical protein
MLSMESESNDAFHISPSKLSQVTSVKAKQVAMIPEAIQNHTEKDTIIFIHTIWVGDKDRLTG